MPRARSPRFDDLGSSGDRVPLPDRRRGVEQGITRSSRSPRTAGTPTDKDTVSEHHHAPGGIEVIDDAPRSTVRLWGDVDASLRDQASHAMVGLIRRGGPFVIDLEAVSFIDSSGLAFMLQLHRVSTDEGTGTVLRNPPVIVLELLDVLGLTDQFLLEFASGDQAPATTTVA